MVNATTLKNNSTNKPIRILSIDGGGTKGIYSATMISIIEKKYGIKLHDNFDFFIGTSSGSIVAAAIAMDIPIDRVLEMFRCNISKIIQSQYYLVGLFMESYNKNILKSSIRDVFGDTTLKQAKKPLAITASNIASASGYIFRSYEDDKKHNLLRSKCYLREVLTASCAAPTYFAPHKIGDMLFADGALWCNNPSRQGLEEAIKLYDIHNMNLMKICSFGAGREPVFYSSEDHNQNWGIIQWGPRLINMIFALQVNSTHKSIKHILPKKNYMRINFEYNRHFDLLDMDMMHKCELWAKLQFKRHNKSIYQFFTNE